jgi:predicted kinase
MAKLIVLFGLPGSGKTTWMSKHINSWTLGLSSDDIREELWGDASIQANPKQVFDLMFARAKLALENDFNIIMDSTNLKAKDRKHLLQELKPYADKCEIVIFATPLEECIWRQQLRARKVPAEVIERMKRGAQEPTLDEGWDSIKVVK